MNDLIPASSREKFKKSFWERPEGTTGMIVLSLIGITGAYVLYKALPYIITLLENTIYATFLGLGLATLIFLITNKRVQTLVSYVFQSIMRGITGLLIEIDPIGVLKNYVNSLKKQLSIMDSRISKLSGMIRGCKEEIKNNEKTKEKALKMMQASRDAGNRSQMVFTQRQAGRMQEVNMTYQDLLTKMELLYRVLTKYRETSDILIQDMEDEIKVKSRQREMVQSAHSAIKSAMNILNGNPDEKAMFDQAMEYLANDYGMKIGEIEDFMRVSESVVTSIDLQNGIYEADALKMLDEWERRSDTLLLGPDEKRLMLSDQTTNQVTIPMTGSNTPSETMSTVTNDWFKTMK